MASNKLSLILIAVLAVMVIPPRVTKATEFWVGGSSGWTKDVDYQTWAKDKVFLVGDQLVFNYTQGVHNVYKVNATAFKDCSIPAENGPLNSGHDVVTLMTPGKKWYICGVSNHCAAHGQKLVITVGDGAPAPAPSSAPASIFTSGHQIFGAVVATVTALTMIVT